MKDRLKVISRSGWPSGPWDGEPDRVEFKTEAGLFALVLRDEDRGYLCGYVAIPPSHPWHPKRSTGPACADDHVAVHGGITYENDCFDRICHVPTFGEPDDVFWYGFDCAHCGDLQPNWTHLFRQEYRTVAFVRAECERLAAQLAQIGLSVALS